MRFRQERPGKIHCRCVPHAANPCICPYEEPEFFGKFSFLKLEMGTCNHYNMCYIGRKSTWENTMTVSWNLYRFSITFI